MIEVTNLSKTFKSGGGGTVTAVDNVSFSLEERPIRLDRRDLGKWQVDPAVAAGRPRASKRGRGPRRRSGGER